MHYFLTGEIQVGKSTAIKKFLDSTGFSACGFKTVWQDGGLGSRTLYIASYCARPQDGSVVALHHEGRMRIFPQGFDEAAQTLLRAEPDADLMIMDELGFMESGAYLFQEAVLARLDGGLPILGVIKPRSTPFLDRVRAHPDVRTIDVSEANRDAVFRWLCENMQPLRA